MQGRLLEICVDSVDSALLAEQGGADRLELCAALSEGGLTPSVGLLIAVKKLTKIPVFVLIRCRQGDFVYSANDMLVMKSDIENLKTHGADGFVFGCLNETGTIEEEQCVQLLRAAAPLPCTFHRAFDCVSAPEPALETVIGLGFIRLLTSGLAPTAAQGADLISRLVTLSAGRLSVMPGGGLSSLNVSALVHRTGVAEVHASARGRRHSQMVVPAGVSMGAASDERCWLQCDPQQVRAIRQALSPAGEGEDAL